MCLALDFIQDQDPVKKGPLGGPEPCDSGCQSDCWLLFVSFGACRCCCECASSFTFIPTQNLVHSTPNWLIVSLQSEFELIESISLLKSHHCETFKRVITLFSFNPRKQQLLRVFGSRFILLKVFPSG